MRVETRAVSRASRPALAPLWDELARRYAASDRPVATVVLSGLDRDARAALADLLGIDRLPAATCRVSTARVAEALGLEATDDNLRALVEELRGPIVNRAAERQAARAGRDGLWAWLAGEVALGGLDGWVTRLRRAGVPRGDVDAHRDRLRGVLGVLCRLPAEDVLLSVLARETLGDPHGLDRGRWAATVVLDAVATSRGKAPPSTAEEARALWTEVGVVADALSSTVLVVGLRTTGVDPLATFLGASASGGEPAVVTLAQLQRWPVDSVEATDVYVVENPSLVADAAARGPVLAPLVCTSGWPNVAVLTLLRQLVACGAELHHHADFDPSGLEIVRLLADRVGARPWRMTAADYLAAAAGSATTLVGTVPDTPWDPELSDAIRATRSVVFEEDVRAELLGEIGCVV